ncbi:DUF2059 domain-containing protein [Flavobacterium subsaxonicum]|uniref:DUF2059 domain-containing protein n=1 Tax=Flavobacterium subsaxonicum WB 4.1-42 = DSM 21790 TaxID=1121898 RepID=A0A0A2MI97_9FLAO|nr:DUF2059 domain-containing protein [Flavobacterium subsaxonicum]KGO92034.1 hypothetical protein Q766_14155 [Flavobacterium subsaxonicum WB 4.1-42 = DSM 21790]
MKKFLFAIAFFLIANAGFAQDAFKKDVLKFLEMSGVQNSYKKAMEQYTQDIPAEKKAEFNKEFDASLKGLLDKMADLYMTKLTHDDVKAVIKFYESPAGKKVTGVSQSNEFIEKATALGQEWGQGVGEMLQKYMQ